jgi:hypothetical protein
VTASKTHPGLSIHSVKGKWSFDES